MSGKGHANQGHLPKNNRVRLTALEAELAFHHVIECFVIIASVGVVDQV